MTRVHTDVPASNCQPLTSDHECSDAGYSLMELLVAMIIVVVVIAGTAVVLMSTTKSSRTSIARAEADRDMALVTESFSRAMRVAVVPPITGAKNPFEVATPERVVFYAATERGGLNPTTAPIKYEFTYRADDQCIVETRTKPVMTGTTVTWPTAQAATSCITQTTKAPKFTYLQAASTATPSSGGPSSGGPSPSSSGTATAGALLSELPNPGAVSLTSPWTIRAAAITAGLDSNRGDQNPTETTVTVALVHGSN